MLAGALRIVLQSLIRSSSFAFFIGLLGTNIAAQSTSIAAVKEPTAIAAIQRAIGAMGGQASWDGVGAATASVQVSPKGESSFSAIWQDDWSSGHNRYRREVSNSPSHQAMVATRSTHQLGLPDGKTRDLPASDDLSTLAVGYPAAALSLSLRRSDCSITTDSSSSVPGQAASAQVVVIERCRDVLYPNLRTDLTWYFSSASGLPQSVLIPLFSSPIGNPLKKRVEYLTFQNIQGLNSPATLRITSPSGSIGNITLAAPRFASSLSDDNFTLTK